jgi:hypothetical protein
MPAIKLNTSELHELLSFTPSEQNLMLVGRHGIGKSQIVTSYFESTGQPVVTFFLGQMSDPGDLIGLMHKNEKTGQSEFLPPFWWPMDGQPIVLFLDELNRARPEILQSVMDLTLNRTLAGKALPPGSRVVSAVNEGEEYQLTDLDPALVSRFNVYEFAPTVEDWIGWANGNGVDSRVVAFLQENSEYLDGDPKAAANGATGFGADLTRTPDRRSWVRVAKTIEKIPTVTNLHIKLIAGIVGVNAAMLLARSLQSNAWISAEDVLLRFAKSKPRLLKLQTHDFAALNERVVLRIQKDDFKGAEKKKVLANFLLYLALMVSMGQSESCVHLASMLDRPRYQTASQFLLGDEKILAQMVEFIQAIAID